MPTLSEMNEHAADAEHQAFQQAYDALLDIAKDPFTCRHFWDAGFTAGQADANDMLTVAHMDGYAKGRDAMRRELEGQEASAWARFQDGEMTHMEMSDGNGADFDLPGYGFVPLFRHPIPPPDVRELVEAGCNLHMFVDLFAGTDESMRTAASCWRDALAKWGNKV